MTFNLSEPVKISIDVVSTLVAIGSFLTTLLPALASLASLVWAGIRIYEWYKVKKEGKGADVKLD